MRKRTAGAFASLVIGAAILTGCGSDPNPPCEQLNTTDPVTAEMRASTIQGAEVEIEVEVEGWAGEQTAECVVVVTGETAEWRDHTDSDEA